MHLLEPILLITCLSEKYLELVDSRPYFKIVESHFLLRKIVRPVRKSFFVCFTGKRSLRFEMPVKMVLMGFSISVSLIFDGFTI